MKRARPGRSLTASARAAPADLQRLAGLRRAVRAAPPHGARLRLRLPAPEQRARGAGAGARRGVPRRVRLSLGSRLCGRPRRAALAGAGACARRAAPGRTLRPRASPRSGACAVRRLLVRRGPARCRRRLGRHAALRSPRVEPVQCPRAPPRNARQRRRGRLLVPAPPRPRAPAPPPRRLRGGRLPTKTRGGRGATRRGAAARARRAARGARRGACEALKSHVVQRPELLCGHFRAVTCASFSPGVAPAAAPPPPAERGRGTGEEGFPAASDLGQGDYKGEAPAPPAHPLCYTANVAFSESGPRAGPPEPRAAGCERAGRRQALLATASLDHTVRVWRRRAPPAAAPAAARGWACTHTLELPGPATFVAFQPRSVQARPPCGPWRGVRPSAHGFIVMRRARLSEQLVRCRCATYAVRVTRTQLFANCLADDRGYVWDAARMCEARAPPPSPPPVLIGHPAPLPPY
jgi:hypothetical protein